MYPLYQDASKVLELMEQRKGTANRLSLNHSIRNKKACLAIAAETSRLVPEALLNLMIARICLECMCLRAAFCYRFAVFFWSQASMLHFLVQVCGGVARMYGGRRHRQAAAQL